VSGKRLNCSELSLIKMHLSNSEDGVIKRMADHLMNHIDYQDTTIAELRLRILKGDEHENGNS
jgi:hypothetical protein